MTSDLPAGWRAFFDSTALLADGPALAARAAADGYLFLPGLLPTADVASTRARFLAVVAAAGWLAPEREPAEGIANSAASCIDPEPRYLAVYKQLYRLEAFHRLQHHPALIDLFRLLFGEAVLVHARAICRNLFPGRPEYTTPAHQDFPHIQGGEETWTAWIPLQDTPLSMGPLAVAEGSHKLGVQDFKVTRGAGGIEVIDPQAGRWRTAAFAAGDVVIFHSLAVHKALPNTGDRLRQSIDGRYQRLSDPVVPESLRPDADVLSWDEVYAGWRNRELCYYWRDLPLKLVAYDHRYYERRDALALAMAERGDQNARSALMRIAQRYADPELRQRAWAALARLDRLQAATER